MERIVYLKRTAPFVHDQITSEAMQEQLALTKRSIGSYFASENSSRIGSGLEPEEEKLLISRLKGIELNDPKLSTEIEKFYSDIVTNIPGGKRGLPLNIGLKGNNQEKLSSTNMPDNLMDYIRYRHALGYRRTAPTPEAAKGNPLIEYYIEDPEVVIETQAKETQIKDDAMTEYLRVKDNNDTVNMLLSLLRAYIRKEQGVAPINVDALLPEKFLKQKITILRELVQMRPERFYQTATDKSLKKKYFIDRLMSTGLLHRTGNIIVDTTDSNRPLGATVEDVLGLLWDGKESMRLNRLKGELDLKLTGKVTV